MQENSFCGTERTRSFNPEKQVDKLGCYSVHRRPQFGITIEVDDGHAIFEVEVPKGWIGKTVGELDIRRKYSINIMATKENGKINMAVSPETVLTDKITLWFSVLTKNCKSVFAFNRGE